MQTVMVLHILAGSLGLVAGFVALYAAKGAPLHRKAGMVFVYVMLAMTSSATVMAAGRGVAPAINIPAALLTAYLVTTALTTVRPPARGSRWLHFVGMLVAFVVGITSLTFGIEAMALGGARKGMPAFPFLMFGVAALLGGVGDLRMMRSGPPRGAARIARHLWRMCFALFIAAMSFFLGQADEIPKAIRIPALLAVPVVAVPVTMFYWLWRIRMRKTLRGAVHVRAPERA